MAHADRFGFPHDFYQQKEKWFLSLDWQVVLVDARSGAKVSRREVMVEWNGLKGLEKKQFLTYWDLASEVAQ